jgi:hypothetical protein
MRRFTLLVPLLLLLGLVSAPAVDAQEAVQWRPSSTEMPAMPTVAELQNDWMARFGPWLNRLEQVAGTGAQGLRASGTPRAGSARAEVVRLLRGPVPVVVITDRNGDDRADMIEYYRDGRLVAQLIDADYSGRANSLRFYDASGALLREERL